MADSTDSGIRITTRGFKELSESFRDAPRKVQDIGRQWVWDVTKDEVDNYIRPAAPSKTGKFASGIQPYSRGMVGSVVIHADPPELTTWILKGTKPHVIAAVNAKALHFYWERRRHWYFFKSVNHPGTKPNDFIKRGAKQFDKQVRGWMKELNKRIMGAMEKR